MVMTFRSIARRAPIARETIAARSHFAVPAGAVVCAAVLFLLTGCGSLLKQPAPVIRYYQLDYAAPEATGETIHRTMLVRPLQIAAAYDRNSIVYRDDKYRGGFYVYDQWIANPRALVSEKLVRDLQNAVRFDAVTTLGTLQMPDLILTGTIEELGERRRGGDAFGAVAMHVTLVQAPTTGGTARILLQKDYEQLVPCETGDPESVVAALSKALQKKSGDLIKDIRAAAR